jgi:hypothetical protein
MKKLLVILCLAAVSCANPNGVGSTSTETTLGGREIYTYTIAGCEYIGELGGDNRNDILAHKGSCKNPIHDTQTN